MSAGGFGNYGGPLAREQGLHAPPGGGGGGGVAPHPWQPYLSPYLGTGTAPTDQGRRIRIRPGYVWDGSRLWLPARRNIEITVPASSTDGYFCWLVATVDAAGLLTSLDYGHGATLPAAVARPTPNPNGPLPGSAYDLLFYVTSNDTTVDDLSNVFRTTPLRLLPQVINQTTTQVERRLIFDPGTPVNDIPVA